jgi:hypothetical protein
MVDALTVASQVSDTVQQVVLQTCRAVWERRPATAQPKRLT